MGAEVLNSTFVILFECQGDAQKAPIKTGKE